MSSNSDEKMEDHSEGWIPIAAEGLASAVPSHSSTSRSITPKGPLFPNLDEAHQAITLRLASRSAGHHIPDVSSVSSSSAQSGHVSGPTDSAGSFPTAQHLEFAEHAQPIHQQSATSFSGTASPDAEWTRTSLDQFPIASPFASSISRSSSVGTNSNTGAGACSRERPVRPEASGPDDSVEVIYDQYYTPLPKAEPASSVQAREHRKVSGALNNYSHRLEATFHRANLRTSDLRRAITGLPNKNCYEFSDPPIELPQISLPDLPRAYRDTKRRAQDFSSDALTFNQPLLSLNSVCNSRESKAVSTNPSQGSSLEANPSTSTASNRSDSVQPTSSHGESDFVIYGRLPTQPDLANPKQDQVPQKSDARNSGISTSRLSIDSDEDPFKFDRGSFTAFLKPSREREVSVALRCISGDSTASVSRILQRSPLRKPATPPAFQSNNPFVTKLHGYQAPAVEYNWDSGDGPSEIKISVRSPHPPHPKDSPEKPTNGLREFVLANQRKRKDIHTLMSDGADWETVAGSDGQFESNRAFASSTVLGESNLVKAAGSSIADYSDTSSVHVPQFETFSSSTERFLPHSVANQSTHARYPRALKDGPVFVPKPRVHRVSGYLQQNSSRFFTDQTAGSSGSSARSALVEKLSASIRSRHAKKLQQRRDQYLNKHWSKSRFQSLESISSTYSEQPEEVNTTTATSDNEKHSEDEAARRQEKQNPAAKQGLLASPMPRVPTAAHLKNHNHTQSQKVHRMDSLDSPTLFSFPLISLEEAARRAAIKAESDDDSTVSTSVRARNNSTMDSSKTAQQTSHIAKNSAAHSDRPTSASILGVSLHHRGSSAYSQARIAIGHDRGISNATSYKSATPLVAGGRPAMSRSARNRFEPTGGSSLRSGSQRFLVAPRVFDFPPVLVPRDVRDAARAAGVTIDLRQLAAMEPGTNPFEAALNDECHLSWEARRRRQAYYYFLCALCIFPFMIPLVCAGKLNSALSWYTRGETGSLSPRQKRNLKVWALALTIAWLVALTVFITALVVNSQQRDLSGGY